MCSCQNGITKHFLQSLDSDRKSTVGKLFSHFTIPFKTGIAEMIQFLAERSIAPVKIESNDMDILTIVFSRKLNAGNDFYWFVLGSLKCLTETIYGVVIGQSESRKMIFHGMFYQLRWCQCSV